VSSHERCVNGHYVWAVRAFRTDDGPDPIVWVCLYGPHGFPDHSTRVEGSKCPTCGAEVQTSKMTNEEHARYVANMKNPAEPEGRRGDEG
jgi:hypothetical protein